MAWEALNNIAVARDSRLVMVVNDNGRSCQPTIGGLAAHLAAVRVSERYEQVLDRIKTTVTGTPIVGTSLYGTLHGAEGPEGFLQPQGSRHQVHRPDRRPRRGDDRDRAAGSGNDGK
jgi:1-deoxy-D-xylulose-5-phosphate synthase